MTIYDLKPAFQKLLLPCVKFINGLGITPNHITVFTLVISLLFSGLLYLDINNYYVLYILCILFFVYWFWDWKIYYINMFLGIWCKYNLCYMLLFLFINTTHYLYEHFCNLWWKVHFFKIECNFVDHLLFNSIRCFIT